MIANELKFIKKHYVAAPVIVGTAGIVGYGVGHTYLGLENPYALAAFSGAAGLSSYYAAKSVFWVADKAEEFVDDTVDAAKTFGKGVAGGFDIMTDSGTWKEFGKSVISGEVVKDVLHLDDGQKLDLDSIAKNGATPEIRAYAKQCIEYSSRLMARSFGISSAGTNANTPPADSKVFEQMIIKLKDMIYLAEHHIEQTADGTFTTSVSMPPPELDRPLTKQETEATKQFLSVFQNAFKEASKGIEPYLNENDRDSMIITPTSKEDQEKKKIEALKRALGNKLSK
jgi:hypothetical protein